MVHIKLKNGALKEAKKGIKIYEFVKSLGGNLFKTACVAELNGKLVDLRTSIDEDCKLTILTFGDDLGKRVYFHTTAHILAQAVKRLYKNAKLSIGPAIADGFYYDFDIDEALTQNDLQRIEKEMKNIITENIPIERIDMNFDEACKLMTEAGEDLKLQLIKEIQERGESISFYKQGEFIDLCRGPHLMSTGCVKAVKLLSITGAYFKGDSKNKMLKRIYGVSFPKQSLLEAHLKALEEAKERDHNKLGRELSFFSTTDYIGQGLPIMMPKGAKVLQILQRFIEDEEERRGYLLTKTPYIAKKQLYQISGHWDHYRDGMFIIGDEDSDDALALRPMTCPFQFQVYLAKPRSYRDLPMRLNETSTLFRNEASGEMHGLIRVRQFTLSEGHIACTPEQLEDEFKGCIDLANDVLKILGLDDSVSYRFSKWDMNNSDKYIGNADEWERVQNTMKSILDDIGIDYVEAEGEAAFYGPKLDIQIKNVHGKEDTLITVQIDFQLAQRFQMTYMDKNGEKQYPYVIHRSSIGCYERTLALLIEKYAGALPVWLMPEQVRILPVSEKFSVYAHKVRDILVAHNVRVTVDSRSEKIGYKIREAQLEKIPYMLIVGEREANNDCVSVRSRSKGDLGEQSVNDFVDKVLYDIKFKVK